MKTKKPALGTKAILIRIPHEDYERFKEIAANLGLPFAVWVRYMLYSTSQGVQK